MTTPVLATKLYIPPTPSTLVQRPHLIARLNAGLRRTSGVTLISAPAGFGKTTLLAQWIPQAGRPVAWLSLDEHDNDPPRFFAYLAAALQKAGMEVGADAHKPRPLAPQPLPGLLIPLLNRLTTTPACALVLDDYHVIHDPAIHQGIAFLLKRAPPQFHLILSSRADPPLPLARLRARQQLTELRATDLRFSLAETSGLFQHLEAPSLSAEQVTFLEHRTEGWVAGLQLVAHALQQQDAATAADFIADFAGSQRYVSDYLADEVFVRQPETVQQFLIQTAILVRFTAELCDVVTGRDDGHAVLAHLEQANLFLVPLDGHRRWYRYHHLFADFLHQQAERTSTPDERTSGHRRASQWYAAHDFPDDAIDHALLAGDWDATVDLLYAALDTIQRPQQYQTWHRWLTALPEEVLRAEPDLCVEYAWALVLGGRIADSEVPLQWAETAWQSRGERARLGRVYATRAFIKRIRGDLPTAIALGRKALTHLPAKPSPVRGLTAFTLALSHHQMGQVKAAERILKLMLASRRAKETTAQLGLSLVQGLLQAARGRLHGALKTWKEALRLAEAEDRPYSALVACALMARVHYEWDDLEQAGVLWQRWLDEWGWPPYGDYFPWLIQGLAQIQWAQGAAQEAVATLAQASRLARQFENPVVAAQLEARRVPIWLAQGNHVAATAWLQANPITLDGEIEYARQAEYLARVRVLLHQGDPLSLDEAEQWLQRLLAQARADGREGDRIELLVLRALWAARTDRHATALTTLTKALTLAEPEGYVRTFVDEGAPLAELLRQIAARDRAQAYVSSLLHAFPRETGPSGLVEPLSEREIEVLRLIAEGHTTRHIAESLVISFHTARTHVKNIYQKLNVHSRVEATTKAHELDLI